MKPGENLLRIIREQYGTNYGAKDPDQILQAIRAYNPEISDINRIYPGQCIILPGQLSAAPKDFANSSYGRPPPPQAAELPNHRKEKTDEIKSAAEKWDFSQEEFQDGLISASKLLTSGATGIIKFAAEKFQVAQDAMQMSASLYNDFLLGKITKGQYQYRRSQLLTRIDNILPRQIRGIQSNKSMRELFRASTHGIDRAAPLNKTMEHFDKIQKSLSGRTPKILKAVQYGLSGLNVANSDGAKEMGLTAISESAGHLATEGIDWAGRNLNKATVRKGATALIRCAPLIGRVALGFATVFTPAGWVGVAFFIAREVLISVAGSLIGEYLADNVHRVSGYVADNVHRASGYIDNVAPWIGDDLLDARNSLTSYYDRTGEQVGDWLLDQGFSFR